MNPLSAIFGAGVAARNACYDRGWLKARELAWPVVSIGNLSVGGSGKTPFTIFLGEWLQRNHYAFDILSRGYGRGSTGVHLVDDKGSARAFGDEPLLMSKKLAVPVIVGEDRYAAGRYAERLFSAVQPAHGRQWLHLLDDGFQHRRLARDFDIVLVTPADVDADANLLPVGRLREPPSALRRADAVVLTEDASSEGLPLAGKYIWRVKRKIEMPVNFAMKRPIAICGVARPHRFLTDLRAAGVALAGEAVFRDHHAYTSDDIRNLLLMREQRNADGFVTTEKDAINLEARLEALSPVAVIPLRMELSEPGDAFDTIVAVAVERWRQRRGHAKLNHQA